MTSIKFFSYSCEPQHGRILRTELTGQGCKIVAQAHSIISKVEASMTSTITEDSKVLLEKLLLECFNNLNSGGMVPDIEPLD